jgi:hypothetical protein
MEGQTKCTVYKTHINQILVYGSECWPFSKKDGNMLRIFESRILRMVYVSINDDCIWRTRYHYELYTLYDDLDIVQLVKIGRLGWLEQLFRMHELSPCRKLTVFKPEGTTDVRNWRRMSQDREQWREIVEEVKVHQKL